MTDDRSLERAARSWVEEGPTRAPDQAVSSALARIHTTRQERDQWVPWRLPIMNPIARVAAIAIIGVVAIGGSLYLFGRGELGPGARPSPTPTALTMAAYAAARNQICDAAIMATGPIKERFVGDFTSSLTPAQRTDWIAAIREFGTRQTATTDAWASLAPPLAFAEAHDALVANYRDMNARLGAIAGHLEAHRDAEAMGVDASTNAINAQILDLEGRSGLHVCP